MLHWLGRIQELVGNGRSVLTGDWNAPHAEWSLDGKSVSVGKVLKEWWSSPDAGILRSRSHTFERRRGDGVVVSRIDFVLPAGGVEHEGLSFGWDLSNYAAIGCMVAVDDLEMVEAGHDRVDWAKVQMTVADKREA